MNLAKGSVFRNSRFLFELLKASGFHKACLWSSLKCSTIVDQMLKIHEFPLLETMLGSRTQCWKVKTWRHMKNYTGCNFSRRKNSTEVMRQHDFHGFSKKTSLYLVISLTPVAFFFLILNSHFWVFFKPPLKTIHEESEVECDGSSRNAPAKTHVFEYLIHREWHY